MNTSQSWQMSWKTIIKTCIKSTPDSYFKSSYCRLWSRVELL